MNRRTIFAALHNDRGTVVIVVALFLITLIGFAALAIDVGHMMVTRNELQNAADAAALATMKKLGETYSTMTYAQQHSYVAVTSDFAPIAQAVASSNIAAGKSVSINEGVDVILGKWDSSANTFTPGLNFPNAVRVITRRDGAANGPVPTFFAGVLGIPTIPVSARATAALTGVSTMDDLPLPVAMSSFKAFDPKWCNTPIKFNPTNDPESCAGWNVYTEWPASAHELGQILEGLTNDTYDSPATTAGETTYNFIGGNLGYQAFTKMKALFDKNKVLNDGIVDKDDDPTTWTTSIPVYDSPDCSNPTGALTIVGFGAIKITSVGTPPDMTIWATIVCDLVVAGVGGGPSPLAPASLPNLVE